MRVCVCGPRDWTDIEFVNRVLEQFLCTGDELIFGDAHGVDFIAKCYAVSAAHKYREYKAYWKLHGRAAGPKRNQEMVDSKPICVVAFRYKSGWTAGTKTTVEMAKRADIHVVEVVEGVFP